MKDSSNNVRKNAAWALGMLLMRDGKAAEKAGDLDIDVKKLKEKDKDQDRDNDAEQGEQSGDPKSPVEVNISMPVPIPVPMPMPRIDVSPRMDLVPGDLPAKPTSKQKDKN